MPDTNPLPVRRAFLLVGHGRRFPGKFFARVEGERVLDREIRVLRTLSLDVALVTVQRLGIPGVVEIPDSLDAGPLGGLEVARSTTDDPFLPFGGDMPYLDPLAIESMRRRFDGRCLIPVGPEGTWQVLHAIYSGIDVGLLRSLRERRAGLRDLVRELSNRGEVLFLPEGTIPDRSFSDIDLPGQIGDSST